MLKIFSIVSHGLLALYTGMYNTMPTCTWSDLNHIESVEPHVNNFSSIICALNKCVYCKEQIGRASCRERV